MADFDFTPDNLEAAGALSPTFDPGYEYPDDPQIGASLEHWRDLKFGVIIHWGIYTAIGQAGSWSLHRDRLGSLLILRTILSGPTPITIGGTTSSGIALWETILMLIGGRLCVQMRE